MKNFLTACLLASAGVSPAQAQPAQTVEGAQKFLSLTIQGVDVQIQNSEGATNNVQLTVIGPSSLACASRITVSNVQGYRSIAWMWVPSIKQSGEYVTLTQTDPKVRTYTIRFNLRSEALAARTAFAMEFLRQACDPAKGTGF